MERERGRTGPTDALSLIRRLGSRNATEYAQARWDLENSAPTFEQILTAYERESRRLGKWETRAAIVNSALAISIFMLLFCLTANDRFGYLLVAVALSIFALVQLTRKARSAFERGMADTFLHFKDVRFIGPALGLYRNEAETETLLAPILTDLLSRVSEDDSRFMNSEQRQRLYQELERCEQYHHFAPEMIVSAIKALVHEGDPSAAPVLEGLARSARDRKIQQAARDSVSKIRAKLDAAEMKQSLLRAAHEPAVPDELLRPASRSDSEPSQLLRAGVGSLADRDDPL